MQGRSKNSNRFPTKIQPIELRKQLESGRPKNFLPIEFSVNSRRTIELFTLRFGLTAELIEQLKAGKLDWVIATQKITLSDIECQLIFEESFWLVGPPNIAVPIFETVDRADLNPLSQWLLTQPWIAYSEELPIIRRFWRAVFDRRIDVHPKLIVPDLKAIRQAVESGFGLSVIPDYLCADFVEKNRLTLILKPSQAVTNRLWLAFRKSEKQLPKIQRMLELISQKIN